VAGSIIRLTIANPEILFQTGVSPPFIEGLAVVLWQARLGWLARVWNRAPVNSDFAEACFDDSD